MGGVSGGHGVRNVSGILRGSLLRPNIQLPSSAGCTHEVSMLYPAANQTGVANT
jgi:hypothetical protein